MGANLVFPIPHTYTGIDATCPAKLSKSIQVGTPPPNPESDGLTVSANVIMATTTFIMVPKNRRFQWAVTTYRLKIIRRATNGIERHL